MLIALALLAMIGLEVHDAVDNLAVLGEGVESAGNAVSGGFDSAADAVDGTPLVGDDLGDALRGAGGGTGGEVRISVAAARTPRTGSPTCSASCCSRCPPRCSCSGGAAARRADPAAERCLPGAHELTPERRRLVAMRAASGSYGDLLRYTKDPLGDLEAGRYDALVAAELEQAGLRPR